MADAPQSFDNHAKLVPAYHYFTFLLVVINVLWQGYGLVTGFSAGAAVSFLFAVAVVMIFFWARLFALGVQDRVIRLEERLRIAELAPDLKPRLGELTIDQVCALRFAGDDELPALARRVLDEKLTDRKAVKRLVQAWRPDHARI
jgi:hypothetical protein